MNKLQKVLRKRSKKLLNIYLTAGYPNIDNTLDILYALNEQEVDLVELGIPFSDPLADGLTIQQSSEMALKNGMSVERLFAILKMADSDRLPPLIAMGYLNQMIQFGEEQFIKDAKDSHIDGLIIPDLPMDIYQRDYQDLFRKYDMGISFLITPETSNKRIQSALELSNNFLYVVSSSATTGGKGGFSLSTMDYLKAVQRIETEIPKLVGFGIHDKTTFEAAVKYCDGAIVGSAFIRMLQKSNDYHKDIATFVEKIRT